MPRFEETRVRLPSDFEETRNRCPDRRHLPSATGRHGCEATWVDSVLVTETFHGETVWTARRRCSTWSVTLKPTRCYAWSLATEGAKWRFYAVLQLRPVMDPVTAVREADIRVQEHVLAARGAGRRPLFMHSVRADLIRSGSSSMSISASAPSRGSHQPCLPSMSPSTWSPKGATALTVSLSGCAFRSTSTTASSIGIPAPAAVKTFSSKKQQSRGNASLARPAVLPTTVYSRTRVGWYLPDGSAATS